MARRHAAQELSGLGPARRRHRPNASDIEGIDTAVKGIEGRAYACPGQADFLLKITVGILPGMLDKPFLPLNW
ncbi:hypothetical protein GCM10025795_07430 [Verticiella sediminum]